MSELEAIPSRCETIHPGGVSTRTCYKSYPIARMLYDSVFDDLENKLRFIESNQYKDYKPFFTDMWDAIIFPQDLSFNHK